MYISLEPINFPTRIFGHDFGEHGLAAVFHLYFPDKGLYITPVNLDAIRLGEICKEDAKELSGFAYPTALQILTVVQDAQDAIAKALIALSRTPPLV